MNELTKEEKEQLSLLLSGRSTLSQGLQLYNSLQARGIPFELEWEEKILELCLAETPDRPDILERYRHVRLSLAKPVPADLEDRVAKHAREVEYGTDHQRAAMQYHERTGLEDTEAAFREIAEQVRPFTMTSYERMYALYKAVEFVEAARIPGDIVECGVWRGGSMMLVAHVLRKLKQTSRQLHLFDTYEGLPRPHEEKDVDIWGNRAIDGWLPKRTGEASSHWANAGINEVRANLQSTGYPADRMHFVKGLVEDTIPDSAPPQIALLRLDTDWYESTKHELQHLFPRLATHGVLIIDDYGHFAGARSAVDEYFAECGLPVLLNRIDYSGRIAVKTT
jgi:O-methyltransferase